MSLGHRRSNVLLHAVNQRARDHETARGWRLGALDGRAALAFSWTVLLAFLRLATHPALEHGATVVSFDRDFGRFEGVLWRLPA